MPGEDDETIIVRAILRDELSDSTDKINKNLDDLQGNLDKTASSTDTLTEAERRNQDQSEKTARQIQAENQQRDERGRFIREETQATESNTQAQKRNTRTRSQGTKAIDKHSKAFSKLNGMLTQFVKAGAMLDAVSMAAQGVGALGGAAIAAGNGLAIMSGALLPIPALITGMAQGAIVGKMAFSGMGDAVSALASGDYAKFGEATKNMAPAMIASAKAMGEFGQKMKPVVKEVQGVVWEGFAVQIEKLGDKLFPALRQSLLGTAKGLNLAGTDLLNFMNSASGLQMLNNILDGTSAISFELTSVLGAVGKGMMGMMNAVMPVARQMAVDIADGVQGLSTAILNNQTKITAFAQRGYDVFKRFIGILVDLGKGIFGIGKAAMGLTGTLGKGLEDAAAKFAAFTNSAEGQNKLKAYFDSMRPTLEALGNLAKVLGGAFVDLSKNTNLADLINQLAGLVPTFQALVEQSSGKFLPALLDVVKPLGEIVVGMNALGATSALLQGLAIVVGAIADAFNALPGPIQTVIGHIVAYSLILRAVAGTSLGSWIVRHIMATAVMGRFRTAVALAAWGVQLYMKDLAKAAGAKFMTGIKGIGSAILTVGKGFRAAALAVRAFSLSLLSFLFTNPIGWIILAVIALIVVFVILWKKCEGFRNVVKAIGQWFVDVWNNVLFPIIMAVWGWMKGVWDAVYGFIKGVVMGIVNFFRSHWDTIKAVALIVWNVIKTAFMVVWTIISTYVKIWIAIFTFAFNVIKTIVMVAFKVIAAIVRVFGPIVVGVFKIIWQIVRIVFYSIAIIVGIVIHVIIAQFKMMLAVWSFVWNIAKTVVMAIWNALVIAWTAIWNVIKTVFMAVWNAILAVIRFLTPIVQAVINFVVGIFTFGWNLVKTIVMAAINFLTPIINGIIGVVQGVMGFVGGIFQSGWNFVSGVVSSVVGGIRGVIDTISGVVGRVVDGIRNGFNTAFGAVRDFVMPIIDTIRKAIDSIADKAKSLANGIKDTASKLTFGLLFAGGPVQSGTQAIVGEIGPEAFVSHTGKVTGIGMNGPEMRSFSQPGYVVPNHVLHGYSDPSVPKSVMSKLNSALTPAEPTMGSYNTHSSREKLSSDTYMQDQKGGGDHYDFRGANFGGNPEETKKAVKEAMREIERNKKERG